MYLMNLLMWGMFMKSVQIRTDLDYEETILVCLFWSTRKTRTFEGCAPLFISKIITNNKKYLPKGRKRLRLTLKIVSYMETDSNHFKPSEIEILIGNELLDIFFNKKVFYVNAVKNKELEGEITEKLKTEFNKVIPRICENFVPKVLAQ